MSRRQVITNCLLRDTTGLFQKRASSCMHKVLFVKVTLKFIFLQLKTFDKSFTGTSYCFQKIILIAYGVD